MHKKNIKKKIIRAQRPGCKFSICGISVQAGLWGVGFACIIVAVNDPCSCLLQDPHAEEFEDKDWTFVIENVSAALVYISSLSRYASVPVWRKRSSVMSLWLRMQNPLHVKFDQVPPNDLPQHLCAVQITFTFISALCESEQWIHTGFRLFCKVQYGSLRWAQPACPLSYMI